MADEEYLSTNPEDAVESAYLHDVDVLIKKARWVIFDYRRKDGKPTGNRSTGLLLDAQLATGDLTDQFLRAGSPDVIIPAKDGLRLKSAPGKTASWSKRCKANRFLESLKEAGFEPSVGGDIDVLDGIAVHLIQEKIERRARPGAKPNERDDFYTLVTKVLDEWAGPVEEKKEVGSGKRRLKRKSSGGGEADVKALTTELVMTVAKDAGEAGAPVNTLGQKVFNKAKLSEETKPHAKAISQTAIDDAFLGDEDAPFGYDEEEGVVVHPDFLED